MKKGQSKTTYRADRNTSEIDSYIAGSDFSIISELQDKKIDVVRVSACFGGQLGNYTSNVAKGIMENNHVSEVYAWDGTAYFVYQWNDVPDPFFAFTQKKQFYDKKFTGEHWHIHEYTTEKDRQGLLRYYRNSNNEVTYEIVGEIYWET